MSNANVISIEITTTDKAGLRQLAKEAQKVGKEISQGLGAGLDSAERKAKESGEKVAASMKTSATKVDKSFDMAARQVGRYLYQIERQAWASGEGMDGAFSESSRKIRSDLDDIRKKAAQTGDDLSSELGSALKKVSAEATHLGESIKKPSSGGLIDNLIGDIPKGAAAAGALGLAVGKAAWDGLQAEWAEDRVGGLLAAQTGAASSAAEGLGNTAGDIFVDNFGTSVEEVGEAMKAVFENKLIDTSAAQGEVEEVTEKIITLAQVTGESFDRIGSATSRMVKTGIAGSVSEAMDLIGHAQEKGLNAQGDLIDTVEEYSTKFRDLGLNGQEAFGLIDQAMEGGARNTDIAADALKEFSLRAQDMSVNTRRGFETIGLDADTMGKRIAEGGSSAKGALQDTLNALEAMPPGIARNSAAVDLFGTKAEDLGAALYDMDLDDAAKKFGDFGGTVEEQMRKISESTSFWDTLGKSISSAAAGLGQWLETSNRIEIPDELKGVVEELKKAQDVFNSTGNTKMLDELKEKYPEAAAEIDAYIKKKRDEKAATDESAEATAAYTVTIDKLIDKQREAAGGVLDLSEATIRHEEAIDAADQALKDNGATLDLTTEKGRNNQSALNDLADTTYSTIEAMRAQAATSQDVQAYMESARKTFIDHAMAMGMSADQAQQLANKLGLIPGIYDAQVRADTSGARREISSFSALLNSVFNRTYSVAANVFTNIGANLAKGHQSGGVTSTAATGGQRHGSTMINEAGPEVVDLPDGSRVATAGATRAMAEMGAFGGGGGPTTVMMSFEGSADPVIDALMRGMRYRILNRHGGSVSQALGKSGVA